MNNMLLNEIDIYEIGVFSDEDFDLEYSSELATECLSDISLKSSLNYCALELNKWSILNERSQQRHYFDFNKTLDMCQFQKDLDTDYIITVVKTWVANNLSKMSVKKSLYIFNAFNSFLELSFFFSYNKELMDDIKKKLEALTQAERKIMSLAVLNFLDYSNGDLDEDGYYTQIFIAMKNDIDESTNTREIPSPKDVVIFSSLMDDFFGKIQTGSPEYFRYFPIYFWWYFTNIIPVRPSEFTGIKKDGLQKKNDEYYIKIPRRDKGSNSSKMRKFNKNRIQIIDTIRIPQYLGKKIEEYVRRAECYGSSKTLLSYPAWEQNYTKGRGSSNKKLVEEIYTNEMFLYQLGFFHRDVVQYQYGLTIQPLNNNDKNFKELSAGAYDLSRSFKPGDTRHLAFLNLMRQGYHPIEIARLGGHTELRSQYHYHNHSKFLIDVEVLRLMSKFKLDKSNLFTQETASSLSIRETGSMTDREFKQRFIFKPIVGKAPQKLSDGFCTHPYQHCPVDDCMLCDYWRITIDEYNEKKPKIQAKIKKASDEVSSLIKMLIDMHNYIIESNSNEVLFTSDENTEINKDLIISSRKLEESILNLSQLHSIEERKVVKDGKEK
ncbi:hypothetical protein CN481_00210 [Bacillus sp. AFS006103]|nr:hypothetical protein CN481_00210 [Bacillus sp. AFS006103]